MTFWIFLLTAFLAWTIASAVLVASMEEIDIMSWHYRMIDIEFADTVPAVVYWLALWLCPLLLALLFVGGVLYAVMSKAYEAFEFAIHILSRNIGENGRPRSKILARLVRPLETVYKE